MDVIVTGGAGFLGSHVAAELLSRGHTVGIFDKQAPPAELLAHPGCRAIAGDFADPRSVAAGLVGADAICHLGGVGDVYLAAQEPHTAAILNVAGTANIAEGALRQGVRRLIYASTWEVYGHPHYQPLDEAHPCNPDHPYNITKYAGELMALSFDHLKDLPVLALRLGTSYGVRMRPNSVFSIFINKALRGETITIQGTGEQSRQFTHATDVARAFALAVESPLRREAINITSAESVSVRQLAEAVQRELPTTVEFGPARSGDISPATVSNAKARQLLNWEPQVKFEEGLRELITLAKEQAQR